MKRHSSYGRIPSVWAAALAAIWVAAPAVTAAAADGTLRCSETARAYASGELGNVEGVEFLMSCVKDRMHAVEKEGKTKSKNEKAQAANNPLTCHRYAGQLSVKPEALSLDNLKYLEACLETDAHNLRQGK